MVRAHIRLSERDSRVNRKLLRATLMQPGLTELTISDMLPQDLDDDLVSHSATQHAINASTFDGFWLGAAMRNFVRALSLQRP